MVWSIYHNPRCSKSRESLALLRDNGIEPAIVLYLETAPTLSTLLQLLQQLDMPARALLRDTEPEYVELGLEASSQTDRQILTVITKHPRLLQRPIVSNGKRAVIGRPPGNVLSLF